MFTPDLLKQKRILITGGGTGLGRATAQRFIELGATVYICGRRTEVLERTKDELSRFGAIHSFACDVRDRDAVEQMLDAIWQDGPLDVLMNNAAGNILARTEELSPRAWDAVLGIVLTGTINCTMACGRRWLAEKRHAMVLSVSTTYATSGAGSAYVVPSAVAKAAVMALTRDGRLTRVLSGLGIDGNDFRLALTEAGEGRIGKFTDRLRLFCYGFDPNVGIYTVTIYRWLSVAVMMTVLTLAAAIAWMTIRARNAS